MVWILNKLLTKPSTFSWEKGRVPVVLMIALNWKIDYDCVRMILSEIPQSFLSIEGIYMHKLNFRYVSQYGSETLIILKHIRISHWPIKQTYTKITQKWKYVSYVEFMVTRCLLQWSGHKLLILKLYLLFFHRTDV